MSTSLAWEGITVGLASHWPCVTDNSGLSTYGLNGLRKGDEHPAYAPSEYGPPLPLHLTYIMLEQRLDRLYNEFFKRLTLR